MRGKQVKNSVSSSLDALDQFLGCAGRCVCKNSMNSYERFCPACGRRNPSFVLDKEAAISLDEHDANPDADHRAQAAAFSKEPGLFATVPYCYDCGKRIFFPN